MTIRRATVVGQEHRPSAASLSLLLLFVSTTGLAGSSSPREWVGLSAEQVESVQHLIDSQNLAAAEEEARALLQSVQNTSDPGSMATAEATDLLVRVLLNGGRQNIEEARELATSTVGLKAHELDSSSLSYARSLHLLGEAEYYNGDYDQCIDHWREALSIRLERLGPNSLVVAANQNDLGVAYLSTRELDEARALLDAALATRLRLLANDHPLVIETLENQASLQLQLGNLQEAIDVQRKAIERLALRFGASSSSTLESKLRLAKLHWRTGDRKAATSLYEELLGICRRAPHTNKIFLSRVLIELMDSYRQEGRFREAIEHGEEALKIRLGELGPQSPQVAQARRLLARVQVDLRDYEDARQAYLEALEIVEAQPNPGPDLVTHLSDLASLERQMGAFAAAHSSYRRALEISTEVHGPKHRHTAVVLNNIAVLLAAEGRLTESRDHYQRARSILHDISTAHADYADNLNNLGVLRHKLGEPVPALEDLKKAFEVRQGLFSDPHRKLAQSRHNLAFVLAESGGDLDFAVSLLEKALETRTDIFGAASPLTNRTRQVLASVEERRGNLDEARRLYEEARRRVANAVGEVHPFVGYAWSQQSHFYLRHGFHEEAERAASSASRIGQAYIRQALPFLDEHAALEYTSALDLGRDVVMSSLASDSLVTPERLVRAWDSVVRSRSLVLDEMARRQRSSEAVAELEAAIAADPHQSAYRRLVRFVHLGGTNMSVDRFQAQRELLESELKQSSAGASNRSGGNAGVDLAEDIGFDVVRAALPPNTALVAYLRFSYRRPGIEPDDYYAAFISGPDQPEPQLVLLGSATFVDSLVRQTQSKRLPAVLDERDYRRAATTLREKIWDPLAHHAEAAQQVFIVPDGTINFVDFGALPASRTRKQPGSYLAEVGPRFHYISSERDLASSLPSNGAGDDGQRLLLVSSPTYGRSARSVLEPVKARETAPCLGMPSSWEPLPGAVHEAETISELWPHEVSPLSGVDATETALRRVAGEYEHMHIITHGFAGHVNRERILETSGAELTHDSSGSTELTSSLQCVGLVMAGANTRPGASEDAVDDGWLTAAELATFDLSRTRSVVVSACDVGRGSAHDGEGVFSIRRALRIAGADTLVFSLGEVLDDVAEHWMNSLYELRDGGRRGLVDAAHTTSLAMLAARRASGQSTHPDYWSPYVTSGDWRR